MKLVKTLGFVAVLLVALMSGAYASTVVDFSAGYTGATYYSCGYNGGGSLCQVFTVPTGKIGTEFDIYIEAGYGVDNTYANVAIYTAGSTATLWGLQSTLSQTFTIGDTVSGNWLACAGLSLPAGSYCAQVWSNNGTMDNKMNGVLCTGCAYTGGYAAGGWAPGTQIGSGEDFLSTVTLVPEPGSLLALTFGLSSLGGVLLRRRRI